MRTTSLLSIGFLVLLVSVCGASAEQVELSIRTGQEVYHPDETLEILVSLTNSGEGFDAELYVAVDYFGTLLFLPYLSIEAQPLSQGYYSDGYSMSDANVFSLTLWEGIPEGQYLIKSAVLSAADYSIQSNIADNEFVFESSNSGSVHSRNEYLPLAKGYSWTYYAEDAGDGGRGTAIVTEAIDNGEDYEFHIFEEDDQDVELVLADDNGDIYVRDLIGYGDSFVDGDQLLLPAEPEEGDHWIIWGSYGRWPLAAVVTVEGKESLSVPAGEFEDCWHLSVRAVLGVLEGDLWLARGVGVVAGSLDASFLADGYLELLDYDFSGI